MGQGHQFASFVFRASRCRLILLFSTQVTDMVYKIWMIRSKVCPGNVKAIE